MFVYNENHEKMLDMKQASTAVDRSAVMLHRDIKRGRLKAIKFNNVVLILESDLRDYMACSEYHKPGFARRKQ